MGGLYSKMRIIHTSDLHLSKDKPETINALKHVLEICKRFSVDMLTIGGDLFDSARDSDILRPQLRREFSGNNFKILAIPGNHDREAYAGNLDFGQDLIIASDDPFKVVSCREDAIVSLPFRDRPSEELYSQLKIAAQEAKTRILLLHCTLDIGFATQDFGEEDTRNYFPVTLATLSRLGYQYMLAGHFHKETCFRRLDNGGLFVYPGSPVSHSKKEIGRRQVVLIDTETGHCEGVPLGSFYHDKLEVYVRPGEEDQVLKDIESWVNERAENECALEIIVRGFIKINEKEFSSSLEAIGKNVEVHHEYRDIKYVLDHPLFRRFKEKLESEEIEDKHRVEFMVLEAMSRLLAEGKLRV